MFKEFVESTVQGLIGLENSRRRDSSSSLAVFCRVDVAIGRPNPQGPFVYYVNEVERSLTVGLFRGVGTILYWPMVHAAIAMMPDFVSWSRAEAIRRSRRR